MHDNEQVYCTVLVCMILRQSINDTVIYMKSLMSVVFNSIGVLTTDPYTEYLHYGRVRLVGGSTANEGRVEIYYSDEWGTVCDDDWDMQDADVVCHQLGYPGASGYRTSATFGKGSGMVWIENVHCSGQETSLVRCGFNGWGSDCDHSSDAGVVCCIFCV
jgi:hypothetical protein